MTAVYEPVRECRRVFMERYSEQLCLTAEDIAPWLIDALSEREVEKRVTDHSAPSSDGFVVPTSLSLNAPTGLPGGDGVVDVASTPALRRNKNPQQTEVASHTTAWARETTPEGV